MSASAYKVPAETAHSDYQIKKSRFLAWLIPLDSTAAHQQQLSQLRQQHPDANHVCWALTLGPPHSPTAQQCSDDGEPSGTAGRPILNVLQHQHCGDCALYVVRYFGGIKLGAGGLVRAYGAAAGQVLAQAQWREYIPRTQTALRCPAAQLSTLLHRLQRDAPGVPLEYDAEGCVCLSLALTEYEREAVAVFVAD